MAGSCDNIQRFPVDCTCNRTAIKSSIIGLTVVNLVCEGIESNGYALLCHIQIGFCISIPGEIRLHIPAVLVCYGEIFYRKGIIVEIGIDMVCGTVIACGNNCTVNFPFHVEGEREIFAGDLILYRNGICTFQTGSRTVNALYFRTLNGKVFPLFDCESSGNTAEHHIGIGIGLANLVGDGVQ